jgi:hypothetical protein
MLKAIMMLESDAMLARIKFLECDWVTHGWVESKQFTHPLSWVKTPHPPKRWVPTLIH